MLAILILAAGNSNRLGSAKQLLPFQNTTLLGNTIAVAKSTGLPIVAVVGARQDEIVSEINKHNIAFVMNENWQTGLSSSLQTGLHYLENEYKPLDAILVMVCDQPFISEKLLKELVEKYQTTQKSVASFYDEILGIPAIITKDFFSEIYQLTGDKGARQIINTNDFEKVIFAKGEIDIDTAEEYDKFVQAIKTNTN